MICVILRTLCTLLGESGWVNHAQLFSRCDIGEVLCWAMEQGHAYMNGHHDPLTECMDTSEDEEELFDILRPDNYRPTGRIKPRSAVHREGASAWSSLTPCACCHSHRHHSPSWEAQVTGTVLRTCGCSARRLGSCSCSSAPPARSRGPAYGTFPRPATVLASVRLSALRTYGVRKLRALCFCFFATSVCFTYTCGPASIPGAPAQLAPSSCIS